MGERRARWGLGYQDKVATARILDILREELRACRLRGDARYPVCAIASTGGNP